jgi:hypothetical protein
MESLVYFAFIVALPVSIAIAVLVGLFATGALFDALDNPAELKQRIEGAFRGTPGDPRPLSPKHYYQPYWRT